MYGSTYVFFLQMLPLNTNIPEAYACGQDQEQNFIQNLAIFLCTFLKEHGALVEKKQLNEVLMKVRKLYCFGTV
jgi:exportin-1